MGKNQFLFLIGLCVYASTTHAQTMTPAFNGDQTQTLPKGRILMSYVTAQSSLDQRFNASGRKETFESQFNRNLTWNEIARADSSRFTQLRGLFLSKGINPDETAPGTFLGDFSGRVNAQVPVLGYGVTDQFGLYLAVPVVRFQMSSAVRYQSTEAMNQFLTALRNSGQSGTAEEFSRSLEQGFQDRLVAAGYEVRPNVDQTWMGDVRLEGVWALQKDQAWIGSLIFPTGKLASPSDLYGLSSGEERFAVGLRHVRSFIFTDRFSISGVAGATTFLPRSARSMRVPRYESDVLSPDIDDSVTTGFSFSYQMLADAKFQISRSFASKIGIQHQFRFADSYSGSYSSERYSYLMGATDTQLQSAFLNIEFNSIRAFLDQDFMMPLQLMAGVALPLAGKNQVSDPLITIQGTLFF